VSRRKGQVGCRTLPEARKPLPSPWKVEARGPPVLPRRAGTMGGVCMGCGDVDPPERGFFLPLSRAPPRHRATACADARPCSVRVMPFLTPHQHGLDLLLRRRAHLRVEEDRNEGAPGEEDVVERVRVPAEEAAERHATSGRLMRRTVDGMGGRGGGRVGGGCAREEKVVEAKGERGWKAREQHTRGGGRGRGRGPLPHRPALSLFPCLREREVCNPLAGPPLPRN
jgi:hypothetical protein